MSIKPIGTNYGYKPRNSYNPRPRVTPSNNQKAVRKIGNEIQRIGWQTDYIKQTNNPPPRPLIYSSNLNRYTYKK